MSRPLLAPHRPSATPAHATLAGTLAIFRRPPPLWAVLLSWLLCARLVATSYRWPGEGPIDFFLAPSSLFFQRVVVRGL